MRKIKNPIEKIREYLDMLQYSLNVEYDTSECTGKCSDYCRCKKILNARISYVCEDDIIEKILNYFPKEDT